MKIAVTAANGQLGSAIVNHLINEIGAENVVGIVRSPEKARHLGIELRKASYDDAEAYIEALKGVDKVLLISGMGDPKDRIPQHRNVINAARANGLSKIVYTSIVGAEEGNNFSPIVNSNRQTEQDIRDSGLDYAIGRNGIYIEPDLEYIDTYLNDGGIRNCAGDGKCSYTSRSELGFAYTKMLVEDAHNGQTYNLIGEAISQAELANKINQAYGTSLSFESMSVEDYTKERKAELGDFLGTVIAGIYEGIHDGKYDVSSDYEKAAGRPHRSATEIINDFKNN